ncbi:MAG: ABC transporter permease [Vicinamibacterales bacterium]
MSESRSRLGRILAAVLIRGDEAPYILRDLDDAFQHDLARGLPPARARARDLRNVVASAASLWAECLRPSAWRPSLLDARLGVRAILRTPWLSLVAVSAIAIGIPVGLAPMHAVAALEQPLPGDPDGRVRTLCYWRDTVHAPATAGDYALWRTSLRSFDVVAAYRLVTVNVDAGSGGVPVAGIETTASAFDLLRTPPLLGRVLDATDDAPGAPAVVVIGHDLWRTQFSSARDIVGRPVTIGGAPFTVVGVMPPGFRFPTSQQAWMPLGTPDAGAGPRLGVPLVVFGRLSAGATPASADAELQALTASLAAQDPASFDRLRAAVLPAWHLSFAFPSAGGLRALPEYSLVQVLLLAPLVVACVNVGLLILAHTSTRGAEFAVRTALGAGRGRILTQVFVEFLVLALVAAGAGLWLLDWLPPRILTALGITVPYWIDTGLTAATVLRAVALAAGCAVIAGVLPAVRMTGPSIEANLRRTRAHRTGTRLGGVSTALIVIDVAVAVVAIGVAGGLWGKVQATLPHEATDGIRAAQVLSVTLDVPSATRAQVARAQTGIVERLRGEPGVRAVTFATALPRMDHPSRLVETDQAAQAGAAGPFKVRTARVATDFFEALAQPLVAGRGFRSADLDPAARSAIVNTTFARRAFGASNPIGRRVRETTTEGAPAGPWLEVVGVVGRLGVHALTPSQDDAMYVPMAAGDVNPVRLAVWAPGGPTVLAPRVRELARAVDPDAVVAAAVPLDQMFEGDWYLLRALVLGAVLLVAVLLSLAASALYAILSLAVSERTREIGIRVALGAGRWGVARDVAARAIVQIGAGVLLGLPLAIPLCYEFLEVTGVGPSVPGAMGLGVGLGASVLLVVSLIACTAPTLRALRIAPMDALRRDT